MDKKVVVGIYTDPETGIRFVEDDRGNYHMVVNVSSNDANHPVEGTVVILDPNEQIEKQNKRYVRILEKLRAENNWLWSVLHKTIQEGLKTPRQAIRNLEKSIKERER